MNAKRPLLVTPFTVQADEESMETGQEPLSTTPSVTRALVSNGTAPNWVISGSRLGCY